MITLREIASIVHGTVVRDGDIDNLGFVQHGFPRMLTFAESADAIARIALNPSVGGVLTTAPLVGAIPQHLAVVAVEAPRMAFFGLHEHLARETAFYGSRDATAIDPSARVHPRAWVAERGVRIGARVMIEPHATILEGTEIGDDVVIRAGTVVGSEGFQVSIVADRVKRLTHAGGVRIGAGAELQANCTIDRALFGGMTTIGDEVTIDNLVYVAHHVSLGRLCRVGASATILGSVTVADRAWIGPASCVRDGLTIGEGAMVSMGSVVTKDVAPGVRVTGNFAVPHEEFIKQYRHES